MAQEIQEYSVTEAALSTLREKYANVTFELSTPAGLKEAKDARADIRGYRTDLEATRKQIKDPVLKLGRTIDAEAARITVELSALEVPIDAQIKAREAEIEAEKQRKIEAEARRVEDLQERIKELRGAVAAVNSMGAPSSENVQEFINDIKAIPVDETFEEFQEQATSAKAETLLTLVDIHLAAVEREAEDARIKTEREELEQLRANAEEREAEERQQREAEEAVAAKELRKQQEKLDQQREEQEERQRAIDAEELRQTEERQQLEDKKRQEKEDRERAEQAEKDQAEAAANAASRAEYPGDQAIVDALSAYFDVPTEVAITWFDQLRKAA